MTEIYEYKMINVSLEPSPDPHGWRKATVETAANRWAAEGWRTVAAMLSPGPGYADAILIERKKDYADLEKNIRQIQARMISADLREEFPQSDIPGYIDREFGGKEGE